MTEDPLGRRESERSPSSWWLEADAVELLDEMRRELGLKSRSEAVRTAIRGFVPILHQAMGLRVAGTRRRSS